MLYIRIHGRIYIDIQPIRFFRGPKQLFDDARRSDINNYVHASMPPKLTLGHRVPSPRDRSELVRNTTLGRRTLSCCEEVFLGAVLSESNCP